MVVQFTNAKVLGSVRLGNLIAIFCKKHFLGYGEIMVISIKWRNCQTGYTCR